MLELLSIFVQSVVKAVADKAVSFAHNDLEKRRSILSKLIILYNATQNLRIASEKALLEFESYQTNEGIPTKVVSSKRLSEILKSFSVFKSAKGDIEKAIEIYDEGLSVLISRSSNLKYSFVWNIINITDEIVPKMRTNDEKKTFNLQYPTKFPKDMFPVIDESLDSKEKLKFLTKSVKLKLLDQMNFVEIDIRDKEKIEDALRDSRNSISTLIEAESQIARLIRTNFTLEKVFDAVGS